MVKWQCHQHNSVDAVVVVLSSDVVVDVDLGQSLAIFDNLCRCASLFVSASLLKSIIRV